MTDLAKKFADDALLLPSEDRAELVDKLLGSLNLNLQEEISRLWAEEAEKRVKEYEGNKIKALDGEEVFKKIRNRIRR
ncbi:MAG: addiction module protein [Ignavibacteriaceae bacterium]|jgi:putative addiction module component (TIGR02574 family)